MDQIVSSVGRENELLGIDCNTGEIEARIPLPKGLTFWAVDSGAYHGKEGEQYSTIRAAAFMGLRYLEEATQVLQHCPIPWQLHYVAAELHKMLTASRLQQCDIHCATKSLFLCKLRMCEAGQSCG